MLDLSAIQLGLKRELQRIPGLRSYDNLPDKPEPPCSIVDLYSPAIEYQKAFAGGLAQINLRVWVLLGTLDADQPQNDLNDYASSGAGMDRSVCDLVMFGVDGLPNTWGDTIAGCTVVSFDSGSLEQGGVRYLTGEWRIEAYCDRR
jgi:hypothetical protein